MSQDIDYYFNTIKECHPKLFVHYAQSIFDSLQASIKAQCNTGKTKKDFGILLSKTNKYTDGHTQVLMSFDNNRNSRYLPCIDFDSNGQMLLDSNYIVSINGIPSSKIARDLDNMVSWEYSSIEKTSRKNKILSNINLLYSITPPYQIKILVDKAIKDTLVSESQTCSGSPKFFNPNRHASTIISDVFQGDSIAVLYYNTSDIWGFGNPDNKLSANEAGYKRYIDMFFQDLAERQIRYLFIDVSYNGGGSDFVHQYYLKHVIHDASHFQRTVYQTSKGVDHCFQFIKSIAPTKQKDLKSLKKKLDAFTKSSGKPKKDKIKGNDKGFNGMVFCIMSDFTYSAGYGFCSDIKRSNAGLLVGEASGQRFPFAGNIFIDSLPNSNIAFSCATIYTTIEPSIVDHNGFLQPDIHYPMNKPLGLDDYKKIILQRRKLTRRKGQPQQI